MMAPWLQTSAGFVLFDFLSQLCKVVVHMPLGFYLFELPSEHVLCAGAQADCAHGA
jgi:hypothetical protein